MPEPLNYTTALLPVNRPFLRTAVAVLMVFVGAAGGVAGLFLAAVVWLMRSDGDDLMPIAFWAAIWLAFLAVAIVGVVALARGAGRAWREGGG